MNNPSLPDVASLVPIYNRLFATDGSANEFPEYEAKSFFLSAETIQQHGRKIIETIAGIANAGRPTGFIMCRGNLEEGAEPPPLADAERLDQVMRASVGPPVHFNWDRVVIEARIVDVIIIPRSNQRPHFIRDLSGSNRFFVPIRGAANNATAARHQVDEMYHESTIETIRRALGIHAIVDNRDESLSYASEIGYGFDR